MCLARLSEHTEAPDHAGLFRKAMKEERRLEPELGLQPGQRGQEQGQIGARSSEGSPVLDAIPAAPPARTEQWIRGILGGEREEAARLFPPRLRGLGVKPPGRVGGGGERRKRKGPSGVQG